MDFELYLFFWSYATVLQNRSKNRAPLQSNRHFSIILPSNTQIISSYLVIFLISLKVTVEYKFDCSSILLLFKGKDIVFYRKLLSTPTSSPTVSRDSPQRRVRIADEDSPQRRVRITDDQPSLHDSYIQRLETLQRRLSSIDSGKSYTQGFLWV